MSVGERMKARRKQIGMSAEQIAEQLNISPSTVYRYENGDIEKMGIDKLTPIAKALRTTPAYLMGWDTSEKSSLPPDAIPFDPAKGHRIPILGRISAGLPLYAEEHIEGYTVTDLNGGAEYFGLRVRGDSMNAIGINDGYIIIVRRQEEVEQGEIAVVMVGEEDATVKRFYSSDTTVTLMPQSTNLEHKPQMYDLRKTNIRILGKVVEVKFFV